MIAFTDGNSYNTTGPVFVTVVSNGVTYNYYGRRNGYDYYNPPDLSSYSRRAQELANLRRELEDAIKEFGEQALVHRLQRMERERKVMLDARSRARTPHTSTRRHDTRRMQTYEAAMAMRQMKR